MKQGTPVRISREKQYATPGSGRRFAWRWLYKIVRHEMPIALDAAGRIIPESIGFSRCDTLAQAREIARRWSCGSRPIVEAWR